MRNLFKECGYSQFDIEDKVMSCWNTIFDQRSAHRLYFETTDSMGYVEDTGNDDARTEGMSYGMMMAVEMNRKDVFDRIWKWAKTYMYLESGANAGFFCWSNQLDGTKNSEGPAPDGEEYFAAALFLAATKWGDGEGIFNYSEQARSILRVALHGEQKMWFDNHHVRFIPNCPFTDPSYHLPHFYELFAHCADEADREFWAECAKESRRYLVKACHEKTGLAAEYATDDGEPLPVDKHGTFFSDSYRVAANIGLDASWCDFTPELSKIAANIIKFFDGKKAEDLHNYLVDGTPRKKLSRHPIGLIATVAQAALAIPETADEEVKQAAKRAVERLWNTPMRVGRRRYYDNCLYFFAILALSGKYEKAGF